MTNKATSNTLHDCILLLVVKDDPLKVFFSHMTMCLGQTKTTPQSVCQCVTMSGCLGVANFGLLILNRTGINI
jgi:hypothetical protein